MLDWELWVYGRVSVVYEVVVRLRDVFREAVFGLLLGGSGVGRIRVFRFFSSS